MNEKKLKVIKTLVSVITWVLVFSSVLTATHQSFYETYDKWAPGRSFFGVLFSLLLATLCGFISLLLLRIIYWIVPKITKSFKDKS